MRRTTNWIARAGVTVLASASLMFPGRVQKPMHEEIRQGVAVASVKDDSKKAESPEFKRMVAKIESFKNVEEAIKYFDEWKKNGLQLIASSSGPVIMVSGKDIEELCKNESDDQIYRAIQKYGYEVPPKMVRILMTKYVKFNANNIIFSGKDGRLDEITWGMYCYVVPVSAEHSMLFFLNPGYTAGVGKGDDYWIVPDGRYFFSDLIHFKNNQEVPANFGSAYVGTDFGSAYLGKFKSPYQDSRFFVAYNTPEQFERTGVLGFVYGVSRKDGKDSFTVQRLALDPKKRHEISTLVKKQGVKEVTLIMTGTGMTYFVEDLTYPIPFPVVYQELPQGIVCSGFDDGSKKAVMTLVSKEQTFMLEYDQLHFLNPTDNKNFLKQIGGMPNRVRYYIFKDTFIVLIEGSNAIDFTCIEYRRKGNKIVASDPYSKTIEKSTTVEPGK